MATLASRKKSKPKAPHHRSGDHVDATVEAATGIHDEFAYWQAELLKTSPHAHAIIHDKIVVIDPFSDDCVPDLDGMSRSMRGRYVFAVKRRKPYSIKCRRASRTHNEPRSSTMNACIVGLLTGAVLLASNVAGTCADANPAPPLAADRAAHLEPPRYTLHEQIKSSIGADKRIVVQPLAGETEPYYIDLKAQTNIAQGVATLLKPRHDFGGIVVVVRVFDEDGRQATPSAPASDADLLSICQRVLRRNPYYAETIANEKPTPLQSRTVVVFRKAVIQYYNDDISDYYGNTNEVAEDVFKTVLQNVWEGPHGNIRLSLTTENKQDH